MIGDAKMSAENCRPKQAMKKPIRLVISNGEYHVTRRNNQERKEEATSNNINNNTNNFNFNNISNSTDNLISTLSNNVSSSITITTSTNNHTPTSTTNSTTNTTTNSTLNSSTNSSTNNNDKIYFGSPLPMYGGRFLGSPMYTSPLTPPLDETLSEEVMQVEENCEDGDRNMLVKSPLATHTLDIFNGSGFQCSKVVSSDSKEMSVDDYLSASSSDDDDDEEVCQLMFRSNESNNEEDCVKNISSNNNIGSNNVVLSSHNNNNHFRHGPDTRSKTNSLRSNQLRDQVRIFSPMRVLLNSNSCRDLPSHSRVLRRFKAIDVTSNRPSLNFRKMRKSSFYRKHPRISSLF